MSKPAIKVANLSKQYILGAREKANDSLSASLVSGFVYPFKRFLTLSGRVDADEQFWALKDVSFEVHPGEVVGIIGRNGAGKSTLLKILSQITAPTEGHAEIRGRIASLLEVGTGFHPQLTGRENIYLNGAILGMGQAEIARKFDEIVSFAGIEKFLDTPIKRYSSGMYVRLAFSVAAHLEDEILIIDEVLAVGDVDFQKKCLGKMDQVARDGRTILFVSHNLVAIRKLCPRTLVLDKGGIAFDGETAPAVSKYLLPGQSKHTLPAQIDLTAYPNRYGSGELKVTEARLIDHTKNTSAILQRLKPAALEFTVVGKSTRRVHLGAICATMDGLKILQLDQHDAPRFDFGVPDGSSKVRIEIPSIPLQCGEYQWSLAVHAEGLFPIDVVLDILPFKVEDDLTVSTRPYKSSSEHGFCTLLADWQIIRPEKTSP